MARMRIDRLALQVRGMGEDEARGLAQSLAERLAEAPVLGASRRIDALRVKVVLADDASADRLAERVAEALLRQIAREEG